MQHTSSPGIVLRTIEHGDHDKIVTVFTRDHGRRSFIAKGAKKSAKRFGGTLELFALLDLVWATRHVNGLPFLQEAAIVHPFDKIRTSYTRTVYASYWCELVYRWMDDGHTQESVFELLRYALDQLNGGEIPEGILHVMFQLHFLTVNGFRPCLEHCCKCRTPVDGLTEATLFFDVAGGGLACRRCNGTPGQGLSLSKGTIKHLSWILNAPMTRLNRLRFSKEALAESFALLEAFVPRHLGKETKSLKLLKQLPVP